MEKNILVKKIKRKFLLSKKQKFQIFLDYNLQIFDFIRKIINEESSTESLKNLLPELDIEYRFLLQENQRTKNENFLRTLYKRTKTLKETLLKNIQPDELRPCADKKLRTYQKQSVEYSKKICNFFTKNGIEYFVTSGTLLGYLRHNGFIPWDDDIDVGMMRKDYEKLQQALKENFIEIDISKISAFKNNKLDVINQALKKNPNKIHFLYCHRYIQIIQGSCIQDSLFLDVFPHDYYKEGYALQSHRDTVSIMRRECDSLYSYTKKLEYVRKKISMNTNIVDNSSKIYYGLDSLDTYLFTLKEFMPKDTIFPLKKILFEGQEFYAPNKMEKYIEFQYKHWKELPSTIEIAPDLYERLNFKKFSNFLF